MAEELTFRKFKKEDLLKISKFHKNFLPRNQLIKSHEPEYYEWKCFKNPVMRGEMWLAEDGDTLVGMKSMTPKKIKILDHVLDGAETGDTYTRPAYQRRGIFTGLFKAAKERGFDGRLTFIYGLPNDLSLPGYEKKLDYAQVPMKLHYLVKVLDYKKAFSKGVVSPLSVFVASPLYNLIKVIDYRRILSSRMASRPFASVLMPIVEAAFHAQFRFQMKGVANNSSIEVCAESDFPDDIDELWKQTSENYDIMLVRNKEYLSWRYVANPDTYSIFIARNQNGNTLGYMVTKTGFSEGVPIGFLADFLTLEDNPRIFKKLLTTAIEHFRRANVVLINTYAVEGSFYYDILLGLGFSHNHHCPVICYNNDLGSQVLSKAYKWHFTMGDSDGI